MDFKQLIAKYASGNLNSSQVPGISYVAFEEGYESPSLWILAGLDKNEDQYIIDKYLQLSLDELGIAMPDKREATLQYANALAQDIINGNRDLIAGVSEIVSVIRNFGFFSENKDFVYDSIFFEHVYGPYDTYDDLVNSTVNWDKDKSNEQLMAEVKKELFEELEKWHQELTAYLAKQ